LQEGVPCRELAAHAGAQQRHARRRQARAAKAFRVCLNAATQAQPGKGSSYSGAPKKACRFFFSFSAFFPPQVRAT